MSTKLELLISDIIVRSYSKCSNCCHFTRTRPETSSPFVDCLIDNRLLQARQDLDQALLQLIHIFHRLLVHMMLYTAPNAVVDRVEEGLSAGQR